MKSSRLLSSLNSALASRSQIACGESRRLRSFVLGIESAFTDVYCVAENRNKAVAKRLLEYVVTFIVLKSCCSCLTEAVGRNVMCILIMCECCKKYL